jgi:LasA protease
MPLQHRVAGPLSLLFALVLLALPRAAPAAPAGLDPGLAAALAERLERLAGPGGPPVSAQLRGVDGWVFGTTARPSPAEHAAPLAYLFLAERSGELWAVALDGEPDFAGLLRRAPRGLLGAAERAALGGATLAAGGEAQLSLPFAVGESWYLTGGPHPSGFDGGGAWSALDLAGGSGVVRAAREGVAFVPCANLVKVYHADGFQTGYYHLDNIQVLNGQPVERGAALGRISSGVGCGGHAYGDHVHFWLMRAGADQALQGLAVGGWTVQSGAAPYQGCVARGALTICAGVGRVANDGAIGDGPPPIMALANSSFEDGDSSAPWQPNGSCSYAVPSDPQQAHEGARYLAASGGLSGCVSIMQNITAAPEPGATYRLAVWARSGDGAPHEATLALWALGPAPRPATATLALGDKRWRCYEVALAAEAAGYTGLRAELYMHGADAGLYHFDAAALARADAPLCPPAQRYRAVVSLEYPAALAPGTTGTITATLRNSGSAAWDASTMLAPLPPGNPPALAEAGWPASGTRIVAAPALAPGEEQTLSFTVRAPDQPGVYSFSLGLVQEQVAWFAEPGEGDALVAVVVGDPTLADPPGSDRLFLPLLLQ